MLVVTQSVSTGGSLALGRELGSRRVGFLGLTRRRRGRSSGCTLCLRPNSPQRRCQRARRGAARRRGTSGESGRAPARRRERGGVRVGGGKRSVRASPVAVVGGGERARGLDDGGGGGGRARGLAGGGRGRSRLTV